MAEQGSSLTLGDKVRHVTPKAVRLISKRGRRVAGAVLCRQCRRRLGTWRFAESNYGVVHICDICKPKVLDRSFGTRDALHASYKSAFESSRRRH
jgi:hypothetical protein